MRALLLYIASSDLTPTLLRGCSEDTPKIHRRYTDRSPFPRACLKYDVPFTTKLYGTDIKGGTINLTAVSTTSFMGLLKKKASRWGNLL